MCWSGEASFSLATAGFVGAYYAYKHKHPIGRWLPLVYFSLMETLQGFTYMWIGQCGNVNNTTLTTLSYLHIAFQPFFVNLFGLSFQPKEVQKKSWWIWILCAMSTLVLLTMLLLPSFPNPCNVFAQTMCGDVTCSYHGNWHIAWKLRLSNLDPHYMCYGLVAFVAPLFYGMSINNKSWRFVTYHILLGPTLMFILSSNKDEQPAIWCLLSIAFLIATHIKVVNDWLTNNPKLS